MISIYTGTPGSGKSLNMAKQMMMTLRLQRKNVIANVPINMDMVNKNGRRKTGEFIYLPNDKLTVPYLKEYAHKNHRPGIEGQTVVCIDEAGIMFNSRDYNSFDRKAWINFFMTHRHYGYNVILVSQHDRLIDRQIRIFIEYNVQHRKANNYKTLGWIIGMLGIPLFVAVTLWYGMSLKIDARFFTYRKKYSKLYDTMMLFGEGQHGSRIGGQTDEATEQGKEDRTQCPVCGMGDSDAGAARGPHPAGGATSPGMNEHVKVLKRYVDDMCTLCIYPNEYKEAKNVVHWFKYKKKPEYASSMTKEMLECLKTYNEQFDIITYIPMDPPAQKRRGYNQAELLAEELSKLTFKPYIQLAKVNKSTQNNALMNRMRRLENKKDAYSAESNEYLTGKRILLIDDVVTSGSTLKNAAEALYSAGAVNILCLTYAG